MHDHDHDLGLAHDLKTLAATAQRRRALRWLGGAGLAAGAGSLCLLGCGGGGSDDSSSSSDDGSSDTPDTGTSSCTLIPEETAGPFPGDGSNTNADGVANVLALSGVVRQDIRSSIAGATGVADGVVLTVKLKLVNTASSCADLSGYAIYIWHCDQDGFYSMYDAAVADENYLRGVQETDASGVATFTTVFPGCYLGRMPHIHFEVYRSVNSATSFSNKLRTSQLAFPNDVSSTVYASDGYATSAANFARISFATDNVFSDGVEDQLSTVTGSVADGFVAALTVGIQG
jgi:protocatechuate 3,4-dioxygenase beta subunit